MRVRPDTRAVDLRPAELTAQATLQGVDAIEAVLAATPDTPSPIIGIEENHITRKPLMEAVRLVRPCSSPALNSQTQSVAKAIEDKDFEGAISLRDPEFAECLIAFRATTVIDDSLKLPENQRMRIGIMQCVESDGL